MSGCREYRDLLSADLDGALEPAEAEALARHLETCPACRAARAALAATVARIRSLPPVDPPDWLEARILAEVRRAEPWGRRLLRFAGRPQARAAALVLICLGGYLVVRVSGPGRALRAPSLPEPEAVRPQAPAVAPRREEAAPAEAAPAPRRLQESAPARAPEAPPAAQQLTREPAAKAAPASPRPAPPAAALLDLVAPGVAGAAPPAADARAKAAGAAEAGPPSLAWRWVPADPAQAQALVLEAVARAGGTVLRREPRAVTARVDFTRLDGLRAALARSGALAPEPAPSPSRQVELTISW